MPLYAGDFPQERGSPLPVCQQASKLMLTDCDGSESPAEPVPPQKVMYRKL